MKFYIRASVATGLILGLTVCLAFTVYAQPSKGIPEYPNLKWGMSVEEFQIATKGKQGFSHTRFEINDHMSVGGSLKGGFKIGPNKYSGSVFFTFFDGSLVYYLAVPASSVSGASETADISKYFDKQYKRTPVQKDDDEFAHVAWATPKSAGSSTYSIIHIILKDSKDGPAHLMMMMKVEVGTGE